MLEQIFMKVLNMSAAAGYCMIAVLLLRILFRKLPAVYSYLLWAAVFFRLVCPVSLESTLSILKITPQPVLQEMGMQEAGMQETGIQEMMQVPSESAAVNDTLTRTQQTSEKSTDLASKIGQKQIVPMAACVWLGILCLLLAASIWSYIRLRVRLRGAVLLEEGVYEKEDIGTAFVVGLCRPKIYIPPALSEEMKHFVLEHEKTHIRRKDYLIKQAAFLISCVYWFHPLVWICYELMCTDMEMACDECVIRKLGKEMRKPYSAALLSLASGRKIVLGRPLAFGESGIRKRVIHVLQYKKRSLWESFFIFALTAAVTVGLALNPKEQEIHTADHLENVVMASGVMPLLDGEKVTVELCMAAGTYYDDTMKDFEPGIDTFPQNYEGSYVLRTISEDGTVLQQRKLEQLWEYRGQTFNFPEKFSLEWADYNADGCPDFTIGLPQSSNAMGYVLLTVRADGSLKRLCRDEISCENSMAKGYSMILDYEKESERETITGSYYDNTVGESRLQYFDYNMQLGEYELAERQSPEDNLHAGAELAEQSNLSKIVHYEGYMDEFPNDSKYMYRKLDLDHDGRRDRVYRMVNGDKSSYEIQFGNEKTLFLGEFGVHLVTPGITSVNITNSKNTMILFTGLDAIGDSPRKGIIALYTQFGGEYHKYELSDDEGGPYLDSRKMRAGYPATETYDAQNNLLTITFQDTDRHLEWTPPEGTLQETYSNYNDTAYSAQLVSYQGENCIAFYQYAERGEGESALFCYVLAVRTNQLRSDLTPYDMELVHLGWADPNMTEDGL